MNKINRKTGNLLMCISELLIGVLLLINPVGFTSGIIVMLGIIFTVLGVSSMVYYFRTSPEKAAQKWLGQRIAVQPDWPFCVFKSNWFIATFPVLTVLYGVLTLVGGISKVQWAVDMLRAKQKYWFVAIISAVLTLVFSALILTNPFTTTAVLWTFIAVTLIIEAVVDIVTYIFGRKSAG